jgi:hypothetical protein
MPAVQERGIKTHASQPDQEAVAMCAAEATAARGEKAAEGGEKVAEREGARGEKAAEREEARGAAAG